MNAALTPPKKKHIPITRRRLDSILPMRDVWTMTICGGVATKARMETISSTAFLNNSSVLGFPGRVYKGYPKVAFSRPPIVSPVRNAISSVA